MFNKMQHYKLFSVILATEIFINVMNHNSNWFSPLINGLLITLVTKINKNLYKFASANVD